MKKITSLLLCAIMSLCLFTSCDDEEENDPIVGRWVFKGITADVKTNSTKATEKITKDIKDESGYYIIELTKDGQYYEYMAGSKDTSDRITGTYTMVDGVMTIKIKGETEPIIYKYTMEYKKLNLIDDWSTEYSVSDFTAWGIENPQSVVVEKALCQYNFSKEW